MRAIHQNVSEKLKSIAAGQSEAHTTRPTLHHEATAMDDESSSEWVPERSANEQG
jgi:hypothetical protein